MDRLFGEEFKWNLEQQSLVKLYNFSTKKYNKINQLKNQKKLNKQ